MGTGRSSCLCSGSRTAWSLAAVRRVDAWEGADSEPAFLQFHSRLPGSQAGQPWCQKGPFRGQKSMLMSPQHPEDTEEGSGAAMGLGCPLFSSVMEPDRLHQAHVRFKFIF